MDCKFPSDISDIEKLAQTIAEATEIEKCSVCLENLQNTVLLWPCTHWFCRSCISNWRKSSTEAKVSCPLCKGPAARRGVLGFEKEQKERSDVLQRLIGAISLDLGFDITTYKKNVSENENVKPKTKAVKSIDENSFSSPVRKTVRRSVGRADKSKTSNMPIIRVTRQSNSSKTTSPGNLKTAPTTPSSPQEVVQIPTSEKVKEWLKSTKFSQVEEEPLRDIVVVDVHAPNTEFTEFSEDQLKSVTQVGPDPWKTPVKLKPKNETICETPSDLDAIKSCDDIEELKCRKRKNTNGSITPVVDKFDELLPLNKKGQLINSTYGKENNRKNKRVFTVESDIFKSVVEPLDRNSESELKFPEQTTESTLEDFSSGSGEEWTMDHKKKESLLKNKRVSSMKKNLKNTPIGRKVTRKSCRLSKLDDTKNPGANKSKPPSNKTPELKQSKSSITKNLDAVFKTNNCQNLVKNIVDEWNESKDIKDNDQPMEQVNKLPKLDKSDKLINPALVLTPLKQLNQRSPGWSRLKNTKKEFHMSEKKKLSLKTLNSSSSKSSLDITPLNIQDQSLNECSNQDVNAAVATSMPNSLEENKLIEKAKEDCLRKMEIKKPKPHDVVNESFASSISPFKGFLSQKAASASKTETVANESTTSLTSPLKGFSTPKPGKYFEHLQKLKDSSKIGSSAEIHSCTNTNSKSSINIFKRLGKQAANESVTETNIELNNQTSDGKKETKSKEDVLEQTISNNNVMKTLPILPENNRKSGSSDLKVTETSNKTSPILQKEKSVDFNKSDCNYLYLPSHNQTVTSNSLDVSCPSRNEEKILQKSLGNSTLKTSPLKGTTEKTGEMYESKKRSRDITVNNGSPPGSPLPKRLCRDVEVQTSPGRMEFLFKDYLKDKWGIEEDDLSEMVVICRNNNKKKEELLTKSNPNLLAQPTTGRNNVPSPCEDRLSQDSDKENRGLACSVNVSMSEKFLIDSDIVLGTEDCTRLGFVGPATKYPKSLTKSNSVLKDVEMEVENYVDPEAITQPYKTPLGPKQTVVAASSCIYSAVSNPTDSELKKVDKLFLKDDLLFPIDTPKVSTVWNSSGVKEIEQSSAKNNKVTVDSSLKFKPSKKIKEKFNRSRRQLDFIDEDSNSKDMFDTHKGKEMANEEGGSESQNIARNASKRFDEDKDRAVMAFEEIITPKKASQEPSEFLESEQLNKSKAEDNALKTISINAPKDNTQILFDSNEVTTEQEMTKDNKIINDEDQLSNASSIDCLIEATPEASQVEMLSKKETIEEAQTVRAVDEPKQNTYTTCSHEKEDMLSVWRNEEESCLPNEELKEQNKTPAKNNTEQSIAELIECFGGTEEQEEDNYCFASSLLNSQQNRKLQLVLESFNIPFSKTVGPSISHLVVGTNNNRTQNSYKFLYAMALHKTIISYDWVEQVLVKKVGETVALDPYLALDPSGECGQLRAYQDKKRILLQDFAIHIYNVPPKLISKEQIEELVQLCGGMVVSSMSEFPGVSRDKFRIIVLSEPPDTMTQSDWRHKYKAAEVFTDWIYNTIGRYRVVPLLDFMVDQTDAVPFLQHEGYPEDLIFDPITQQ